MNTVSDNFSFQPKRVITKEPVYLMLHPISHLEDLKKSALIFRAKTGDSDAAEQLIACEWPKKIILPDELKQMRGQSLTLVSVPGTTGKNKIPAALACYLAEQLKKEPFGINAVFLNGDLLLKSCHTRMLKLIPNHQRVFFPRQYAFRSEQAEDILRRSAPVMLVEDLLMTGTSAFAAKRFFDKNDIPAPFLAALLGSHSIIATEQQKSLVLKLLNRLDSTHDWVYFIDDLSREEMTSLIVRIQQVLQNENAIARQVLTNRLHLSYRERLYNDKSAGDLLIADLTNDVFEHQESQRYSQEIQDLFKKFNTTVEDT